MMITQVSMSLKMIAKIFLALFIICLTGCNESEYAKLVKTELAKNNINETLIFDFQLGESKKEFHDKCWSLNNKGIIMQGPKNDFVQYELPIQENDTTTQPITLLFYGIFDEKKTMTGMDMQFFYQGWSLWNKSLQAEQLVPVVKDSLKSWFPGNDFITVNTKKSGEIIHVKVDGTRRILIEPLKGNREVDVRIDDLRYVLDKL